MWADVIAFAAGPDDPSELGEAVTTIAIHFAKRAPTPSYGWWALAGAFAQKKLRHAAAVCAERALQEGEVGDGTQRAKIVALCVDWAVREGEPETLKRWLRIGQTELQ